ncbi:MAG: molybdopterin molybdotransferase MoeA [Armatimonadetes bacterium]|nr:molybdopterin molybdotransferase MoeA [Armatimonadota bacterium]
MNKFEPMITVDEASRIVDEALGGVRPSGETVPVRESAGMVALRDQVSRLDLPAFDKSAMDGYAVLGGDERDQYRLLETVPAGSVGEAKLVPGTTVKVMTGAAVPEGAARVIRLEHAEELDGVVRIGKRENASNICKRGEDVRVGDPILPAGTVLGALEIANLISCGITEVEVARLVRAMVISTGDEIVDSPDMIAPGKIMNSNGPMLVGLAREAGLEVVGEESVPDEKQAVEQAIRRGMKLADIVMLSGGVSVGEFDFVLEALSDVGLKVHFTRLAVQPGKPTVFTTSGEKAVFGLPGNPVSVFLMFHLFVLRAAAIMSGRNPEPRLFRLRLSADYSRTRADRQAYVPSRLREDGSIETVAYHGSAHISALMSADGFLIVPIGVSGIRQAEEADFLPISPNRRIS